MIQLLVILIPIGLQSQKWEVHLGLSNQDEYAANIIEDYDGGLYIIGNYYPTTNNTIYGWHIKTDVNGNLLYDKTFTHNEFKINEIAGASDQHGNKYFCGTKFNNTTMPYVIKLDSCGGLVWCKLLYEGNFEEGAALDILINDIDELVVLTWFDTDEKIDIIYLIGMSMEGDVLWKKPYASRNDYPWIRLPIGYDMEMVNNEYYISGDCYYPYPSDTNHFFLRPLFIGVDSLFNEKWVMPFMALDSVFGLASCTVPLNDTVLMGIGSRWAYGSIPEDRGLLMFYNTDGEELGYKCIINQHIGPDIISSWFRDIARINDSLFMVAASFGPDVIDNPNGELVIDTSCNVYFSQSMTNTLFQARVIKTSDDNYVFTTSIRETKSYWDVYLYKVNEKLESVPFDTTSHTYDSLCPHPITSGVIDLTSCLVYTDIGE
ncbi:MAG: hypothetical protein JW861_13850, partial [Bacteroidales bacterium]|nr:hypothetical protein [Bacteroidales bacterium]